MATLKSLSIRSYLDLVRAAVFGAKFREHGKGDGLDFARILGRQAADKQENPSKGLTTADYFSQPVRVYRAPLHYRREDKDGPAANGAPPSAAGQDASPVAKAAATPASEEHPRPSTATDEKESAPARDIIEQAVHRAAAKYDLPPRLIRSVIRAESDFRPDAVSPAGARGLMQLMPGTAQELGVTDAFDVHQNIDGGSRYLRKMLDRFGGNLQVALAAYNAGPGTVQRYNGRVPYRQTQEYVKRVMRFSGERA